MVGVFFVQGLNTAACMYHDAIGRRRRPCGVPLVLLGFHPLDGLSVGWLFGWLVVFSLLVDFARSIGWMFSYML